MRMKQACLLNSHRNVKRRCPFVFKPGNELLDEVAGLGLYLMGEPAFPPRRRYERFSGRSYSGENTFA
jgi:hypothetical protein